MPSIDTSTSRFRVKPSISSSIAFSLKAWIGKAARTRSILPAGLVP